MGGNLGGPIKKNKLFIFGDYLRVMHHEANTNLVTIPPNPWRTGDLRPSAITVYDPATGNPLDGTGRTPFPGNIIPANRINAVSAAILRLLPPTDQSFNIASPINNYYAALPYQKTTDSFDVKMDYNITDKDRLSGRFSFSHPVVFQAPLFGSAGGDGPGGAFMGTGTQRTYSSNVNYDHVVSPTLVAERRLAVSHYHNEAQPSDYGSADSQKLGIPGVNINQFTSGIVGIQINDGFSNPVVGYSASLPWVRAEANVDIANTWTKTKGNHTIKWGIDLKRIRDDLLQDQTYSPRGIYYFGNEQTALCTPINIGSNGLATSCNASKLGIANDMASFLLDVPYQLGRDINHGPQAWVLGNWQLSGVVTLLTGIPITTFGASGSSLNTPGETQTADQVAPVQILHGINVGNPWFSTCSFTQPTGVRFGTSGRNILSGPGLFALNLSLFKNFKIKERTTVELRAETFNFTNTPQFSNPSSGLTSSTYGYVTGTVGSGTGVNGTGGGRAVQLGAKVTF